MSTSTSSTSSASARDQAIAILSIFFKNLFKRTWQPWGDTHDQAVARLIDLLAAAAVRRIAESDQVIERITEQVLARLDAVGATAASDEVALELEQFLPPRYRQRSRPSDRTTQPLPTYDADAEAAASLRRMWASYSQDEAS